MRIELTTRAWKARVIPFYDARFVTAIKLLMSITTKTLV